MPHSRVFPLRILYLVNALEVDAPTSITLSVAAGLQKLGHQIQIVAWSRGGPLALQAEQCGVPCSILTGRSFVQKALQLRHLISTWRPSIVHSVLARPALGVAAARLMGLKPACVWVIGEHGTHEWHERGAAVGRLMEMVFPAVYSLSDAVATVSPAAARQLHQRAITAERVHVLPNGIDPTKYYPRSRAPRCACAAQHFPDDDPGQIWPLIGTAGNLRKIKGHADLLHSMPQVLQSWPTARLIIWGTGPETDHLQTLAKDLHINHAVSFAGAEAHLERLFPLLDLYVQPSLIESFGLAPAEAMACGIPAVVSDAGNLPLLANYGQAAWIYPAGNADALASTVLEALYNKQRLKSRGATGRGFILKHFTLPQLIEKTAQLYAELYPQPVP